MAVRRPSRRSRMGKHKHKDKDQEKEEVQSSAIVKIEPVDSEPATYEELVTLVSIIANPMASKKLTKKLYKVVKKSRKAKKLKRGVREVVKGLRKNEKGLVILAGDVSPIDVITHIPVLCEDNEVPYCYVPSRRDLGAASLTKRPTSVVMVKTEDEYKELYDECFSTVDALPLPI